MKNAILFAAFMLIAYCGFSQHNYKFNYQAVVRDGAGTLVANGSTVGLRISILEGSAAGTVLYQETHSASVNNSQGIINLIIGDGTPVVGSIVFAGNFEDLTQEKFLKIEVDPAGGSAYADMGATKLQFVPYAAHAFTATIAKNGTQWATSGSDISYDAGKVNVGTSSPIGTGTMNIEKSTNVNHVLQVTQTGTTSTSYRSAIYGRNNATGNLGIGVYGEQMGDGYGVYGKVSGTGVGSGIWGDGPVGVTAVGQGTTPVSVQMSGFLKVMGTSNRTAFQIPPSTTSFTNRALIYANQQSNDIIFITPFSNSVSNILPAYQLMWSAGTSTWSIWNVSDDGTPSAFPIGTGFNVLVIKQ